MLTYHYFCGHNHPLLTLVSSVLLPVAVSAVYDEGGRYFYVFYTKGGAHRSREFNYGVIISPTVANESFFFPQNQHNDYTWNGRLMKKDRTKAW